VAEITAFLFLCKKTTEVILCVDELCENIW